MKKNIYWIVLLVVIFDQFCKFLVIKNFSLNESIALIPNFFSFTYVQNTGGAWSILSNQVSFLTMISAICLIGMNWYLTKITHFRKLEFISYSLLMGGILGNLIDRLVHQYVIDFFHFQFFGYHFPVFNIADIALVIGVGLFIIDTVWSEIICKSK